MKENKIEIASHSPNWLNVYQQEVNKIKDILKNDLKAIHFIGSTAIPGMPAKPIIDILIELEDLDKIQMVEKQLSTIGFEPFRRQIIPYRSFFSSRYQGDQKIHLHIYEQGDPQVARHVNFRDYLIQHPQDAQTYAELKKQLAQKFENDLYQYVLGKGKLVQAIDRKAKQWAVQNQKYSFLPQSRGKPLKDWTQKQITHAIEANFNVFMTHFPQFLEQVEFIRQPGFTLVNSGLPNDAFNYILDADFPENLASKKISEASAYFAKSNVPFAWWISPHDQPKHLMYALQKQNFQHSQNITALSLDLDLKEIAFTEEFKVIRADDPATLQDFAQISDEHSIFKEYYGWIAPLLTKEDPIEYYVGYLEGKPVARGISCYYAGVCSLYGLFTTFKPDEIKENEFIVQMLKTQLRRARTLGYHVAILQVPEEREVFYHRLGCKHASIFKKFKHSPLT